MHYAVTARFKTETAAEFLSRLTDGSIDSQKPDGQEILASMKRATIDTEGIVRWSEKCFCPTPLQHERATVYDDHFTDIETEEIDGYVAFEGKPLIEFLEQAASGKK